MKLRNINRGLALGLVVAVGTTAYVIVDNSNFKNKSKPEIETISKKLVEDVAQSNVGSYQTAKENWNKIIEDYFMEYSNSGDYYLKKSDFKHSLDDGAEMLDGEITKSAIKFNKLEVTKCGTEGANVEVDYDTYFEFTGTNIDFLDLSMLENLDLASYDSEESEAKNREEIKKKNEGKTFSTSYNMKGNIYMLKEDGKWKVAGVDVWPPNSGASENIKEIENNTSAKEDK